MEADSSLNIPARTIIRPSIKSVASRLAAAFVAALAVHLWFEHGWSGAVIPVAVHGAQKNIVLPLSLLVLLILLARPLVLLIDSVYTIGNHHLYAVVGRCSLKKKHIEIPYEDMRGVRFEQSMTQRLLDVGVISVWTATSESAAITMRGIAHPEAVTSMIRERIDEARMRSPASTQPDLDRKRSRL
jgi:uncharacterized membrane protein YdbT with pleckstrin-like domain